MGGISQTCLDAIRFELKAREIVFKSVLDSPNLICYAVLGLSFFINVGMDYD